MTLDRLPADCLLRILDCLEVPSIQELALTTKEIRRICMLNSYKHPITLPLKKTLYPEIILKTATTIEVTDAILKTGSNWLADVLNYFKRVRIIKVTARRLMRSIMKSIWDIIEESNTIKTLIVPNNELRLWCRIVQKKQSTIEIRPLCKKNLKKDEVSAGGLVSEAFVNNFNRYMINATTRYEAGEKLDNACEVLSLSNIIVLEDQNKYGIDPDEWTSYNNNFKSSDNLPIIVQDEKSVIMNIIEDYVTKVLKDANVLSFILSKYEDKKSSSVKLCLNLLKYIDNVIDKSWIMDGMTKEEDVFITSFVDTILINPMYNTNPIELKRHGNGHSIHESRFRKVKQAKKNGDTLKGWRGRVPDRSFELQVNNKNSFHVFLCEVKTSTTSKKHPDFAKIGAMLKDVYDFASVKGVQDDYTVVGLLIEGVSCTIFSMSKPIPKLYHMRPIKSFNLPVKVSELNTLDAVVDAITLCQHIIRNSCQSLEAVNNITIGEQEDFVHTNYSPSNYSNYYT